MNPVPLLPPDERSEFIEEIATRTCQLVLEALASQQQPPAGLVDPKTLAALLGVSRATVYEHADELGGLRIGGGRNARLRFDAEQALQAWTSRSTSTRSSGPEAPTGGARSRRRRTAARSDEPLLAIAGVKHDTGRATR